MRNDKGQFVKGKSGNPKGRSPKERETKYYDITMTSVTFEDWKKIVKKAVQDAIRGDTSARKFLADYLIGPPIQKTENTNIGVTWQDFIDSALDDDDLTE